MKDFSVIPMLLPFENWDFFQIPSQVCSKTTHKPKKLMFNIETTFVLFSLPSGGRINIMNYFLISKNTYIVLKTKIDRHFRLIFSDFWSEIGHYVFACVEKKHFFV